MEIRKFFSKWFYISLLLILVGLIFAASSSSHPSHMYLLGLISKFLESVGIAIFVAHIFTFTLGTEEFISFIRDRLINVVLSKDFVTKLSPAEQKNLLHMVLKPTKELSSIYSGINDYFNQYVEESMSLFDTCYRGHMVLDGYASYNQEKGCIQIRYDLDYMVYKIGDEFESLKLGFEDDSFEHVRTIIRAAGEQEQKVPENLISEIEEIGDPTIKKLYNMTVPTEFNKHSQINVSRRIIEYGNDHWQVFSYKTIKACDRLTVVLRCEAGLEIKNSNIYGVQDECVIEEEEGQVKVVFNDWLSPGFGVSILVAKKEYHNQSSNNKSQLDE